MNLKDLRLVSLILRSKLFCVDYLREQRPDLPANRIKCAVSYIKDSSLWALHPHPLFDAATYLQKSPDLRRQGVNPLAHYLGWGHLEGREPNSFFDSAHYRSQVCGDLSGLAPLEHYLRFGAKAGLKPYPLFDYDLYRQVVDSDLPNSRVLADFASNRDDSRRRDFASQMIEKALTAVSRADVLGSLEENERGSKEEQPSKTTLCDIVIPVKNAIDWCERAFRALALCDDLEIVGEIICVDDGCSPECRKQLEQLVASNSKARLVTSSGKHGFAAACNLGFSATSACHVLFLNSDCLVNRSTISKLLKAFERDKSVGLACAAANNAANATIALPTGESFISFEDILEQLSDVKGAPYEDICTTVGHCLMVSRDCYHAVNGMDESWGLGYGEESDLHLRARAKGYRGVLVTDAYVYHFGGGTFRNENNREELQQKNHQRFMTLWGESFACYHRTSNFYDPVPAVESRVRNYRKPEGFEPCDVLFVLPGLSAGIGGVHVVLDLCNHLIISGINAKVVVMGALDPAALRQYAEPLYLNPLRVENENELVNKLQIKPKIVVSTLFSTVPASWKLAQKSGAKLVNFVQGYEPYFQNGIHYEVVKDSYFSADLLVTTSEWLARLVRAKAPNKEVVLLPIGVNHLTFFPKRQGNEAAERKRVGVVFRSAADKGQFVLRELVDLLFADRERVALTVFKPADYPFESPWIEQSDTKIVTIPVGRDKLATYLRDVDIFVDASLHEGFGLLPLEALACGAAVVASNSGGVNSYLRDGYNGLIEPLVNQPESYLAKVRMMLEADGPLASMRENAAASTESFSEFACFERYAHLFARLIRGESVAALCVSNLKDRGNDVSLEGRDAGAESGRTKLAHDAKVSIDSDELAALVTKRMSEINELRLTNLSLTHQYQMSAEKEHEYKRELDKIKKQPLYRLLARLKKRRETSL